MGNFWKKPASSHQTVIEAANAIETANGDSFYSSSRSADLDILSGYFSVRYVIERALAVVLLIPVIPVIFVLGCLVRLNSRGPAIYKQSRVGLLGKEFFMYKIRTMVVDAEGASGPKWCAESDPRVTSVGKLLRFLHLDELPQLLNIALGQMSFIGPRPERPAFVYVLRQHVTGYDKRLMIKPGITGLAQIYLPADQTLKCVRKKIKMDDSYIQTAKFTVDLQIAICTVLRMAGLRNGKGPRWMGLDRQYRSVIDECRLVDQNEMSTVSISDIRFDQAEDAATECYIEPQALNPVLVGANNRTSGYESSLSNNPNKPR